jgi:hypothetical protein
MTPQPADAPADPVALADLMFPATVRCLAVAAQFRIADLLADGPLTVDELAEKSGTHAPSLHAVLRLLAADGVFAEAGDGAYRNTPRSDLLRPDVPGTLHAMARMVGEPWLWASWGGLDATVATGRPAFEDVHGTALWPWLARHPASARLFNEAMTDFSEALSEPVARSYPDFAGAGTVADLGGGQGAFLARILRTYPSVRRGVLVDLPQVVEQARHRPELADLLASGRLELAGLDFFQAVPDGVDVYVTKQVMHSWDDSRVAGLLRRCRETSPGARFLAAEFVHSASVSRFVANFDLVMRVTMAGGIRTAEDFARLYGQSGYRLARVLPTGTAFSLVEGTPA